MNERRVARVDGVVQGVGFRPHVARVAQELGLAGSVSNLGGSVHICVEGARHSLDTFQERLISDAPPAARIDNVKWVVEGPDEGGERSEQDSAFRIVESTATDEPRLAIPPDLAICADCRAEVDAPDERRFDYPFTNCTNCGPRYTVVHALPYDRHRTTMAAFEMCAACKAEYDAPTDRRYHAQPIACPNCGPSVRLVDAQGARLEAGAAALDACAEALRRGRIVAVQGLGGFQLLVDAKNDVAVRRLRARKHRPDKALAVMVRDMRAAESVGVLRASDAQCLTSCAAPIVLVQARPDVLSSAIAPGLKRVGILLPTTPLHHRLLHRFDGPVVCTSGNLSDEPIATSEDDARGRLATIADVFLVHDRPIARRCDDAVVQVVDGAPQTLRLGRGLGPLRMPLPAATAPILAVGGHLKNAGACAVEGEAVLWPHVGDLDTPRSRAAFDESLSGLCDFMRLQPALVACDAHPDYASTQWAEKSGHPLIRVQHHHAHVAAVLAEHGLEEALGVAWDGAGYGDDGSTWGGEFLEVTPTGYRRVAHMVPFRLPGGDRAAREGWRAAASVCERAGVTASELGVSEHARYWRLSHSRAAPKATSVGRLFDAVAAITGIATESSFEGHAAMRLETLASSGAAPYEFKIEGANVDWRPALRSIAEERTDAERVASRFHATLVAMLVPVAARSAHSTVVLSGGCFQNVLLAEESLSALRERGYKVRIGSALPPGDGGLALGQAWVAAHELRRRREREN